MPQPKDPDALYAAIKAGEIEAKRLTLNDLAELIARAPGDWHKGELLWLRTEYLLSGEPPRWLGLCRHQAQLPLTDGDLWYREPRILAGLLGAFQDKDQDVWAQHWPRAALAAARAVVGLRNDASASWSPEALDSQLTAACACVAPQWQDAERLHRDAYALAREFLAGTEGRQAQATASIIVLGVWDDERGYAYALRVDLLPDGGGQLYPVWEQAAIRQDEAFARGLDAVERYLRGLGLWPTAHDLRFSLARIDGVPTPQFEGASASAAFALTIASLLVRQEWPVPPRLPGVEELDLIGVAVSAELQSDGKLGKVNGLWWKLMDVPRLIDERRLHTVGVCDKQDRPPKDLAPIDRLDIKEAADFSGLVAALTQAPWRRVRDWQRRAAELRAVDPDLTLDWGRHYQDLGLFRELREDELKKLQQEAEGHDPLREDADADRDRPAPPHARELALRRWEEAVRQVRVTVGRRQSLEEVLTRFGTVTGLSESVPRFFLLGPPGSGKTTLAYALAHKTERWLPVVVRLVHWAAWVKAERAEAMERAGMPGDGPLPTPEPRDLARYLAHMTCEAPERDNRHSVLSLEKLTAWWTKRLIRGDVLLLLDGLDELESTGEGWIEAALGYTRCAAIVTCRTLSWESWQRYKRREQGDGQGLSVFYLGELGPEQWQGYINAYPAQHAGGAFPREQLIAHLERTPQLHAIATTPQLLAMLCYLADDPDPDHHLDLPVTRGELYERLVMRFLSPEASHEVDPVRRPRAAVTYPPGTTLELEDKRSALAQAALALFASMGERQLWFDCKTWRKAVKPALGDRQYLDTLADALRTESVRFGLLRFDGARNYFLHLTVQEYLVAQALADRINDAEQGWDAPLSLSALGKKGCTVRSFVSAKAWSPAWSEVIVLLAGRLKDPEPLLAELMDETHDDILGHRRTLACACLPELGEPRRILLPERVNELTETTWQSELRLSKIEKSWSSRAFMSLPSLATAGGAVAGRPLVQSLSTIAPDHWLHTWSCHGTTELIQAVVAAAPAEVEPVIEKLVYELGIVPPWWRRVRLDGYEHSDASLPKDEEWYLDLQECEDEDELNEKEADLRSALRHQISAFGAATPVAAQIALGVFARRLAKEADSVVRAELVEAIGALIVDAPTIAEPGVRLLPDLLEDCHSLVRHAAAMLLARVAAIASPPEGRVLALVRGLRMDGESAIRQAAAGAFKSLVPAVPAIAERVVAFLSEMIADTEPAVREAVVRALGEIGAAMPVLAMTVVDILRDLHTDADEYVRREVVETFGTIGATAPAVAERVVALLSESIADTEPAVREAVVRALGKIGAAMPVLAMKVVDFLGDLYTDEDEYVRREIVETFGAIGAIVPAIAERVVAVLSDWFVDDDSDVRPDMVRAIREIGTISPAVAERVVALLFEWMAEDEGVRESAAAAVSTVGPLAPETTATLVARLADRLVDEGERFGDNIVKQLKVIGSVAPGIREAAARAAVRVLSDERFVFFDKDGVAVGLAQSFSDTIRVQRRREGWAMASIEQLALCDKTRWEAGVRFVVSDPTFW